MGIYERGSISVQLTGEKTGKIFDHQHRVYEGELKNLEPHGEGTFFHDNGTYHEGNFKKGNETEKGVFIMRMAYQLWRENGKMMHAKENSNVMRAGISESISCFKMIMK